jgi:Arc/MetJ family transcription regulator
MRTNIVLDDKLVEQGMRLGQAKSKRDLIDKALREFVARHTRKNILDLPEQKLIDADYDVRAVRDGMNRDPG